MHRTYPYTIENGTGERITSTGRRPGPAGECVEIDGVAQPGAGPPMHVHSLQEEAVRVVRGRVARPLVYRLGAVLGRYEKFKNAPAPMTRA